MNKIEAELIVSVVSHNQAEQVRKLLDSIEKHCQQNDLAVVLTLNVEEKLPFAEADYSFPLSIIKNIKAQGYGANHNHAFTVGNRAYFCVLNPDVWFSEDPFHVLIEQLKDEKIGVIAPAVYNSRGLLEDNARKLPTPIKIIKRWFARKNEYFIEKRPVEVDWLAGMFMLFKEADFKGLDGFDEKYYLYCEDIDICSRIWLKGKKVLLHGGVVVRHDAQHSSHYNVLYFYWHLSSLIKLFTSASYYKRFQQKINC